MCAAWLAVLFGVGGWAALVGELTSVSLMAAVGQLLFHLQHTFPVRSLAHTPTPHTTPIFGPSRE